MPDMPLDEERVIDETGDPDAVIDPDFAANRRARFDADGDA